MSAMRKAIQYLGFDVTNNNDDYDEYPAEEYAPVTPISQAPEPAPRRELREVRPVEAPVAPATDFRRIQTIKPRSYADAKVIGEAFRQGIPVILNLTEMADGESQRMVDFAVGLSFGLHGNFERVAPSVFLISPAHVEIAVDTVQPVRDQGFFN